MKRREEINRQQRVADQMVTVYSALRDRYSCRASSLTLGIFLSSVILATATFLREGDLKAFGVSDNHLRLAMGVATAFVLFASVAELALRWREKAQSYYDAAQRLARVKAESREALTGEEELSETQFKELTSKFNGATQGLPGIPDSQFVTLKAYHQRKVRLSQMCDESVGCPVWILRLRLLARGLRPR